MKLRFKHQAGKHDQKTHGRRTTQWTTVSDRNEAKDLVKRVRKLRRESHLPVELYARGPMVEQGFEDPNPQSHVQIDSIGPKWLTGYDKLTGNIRRFAVDVSDLEFRIVVGKQPF